MNGCQSLCSRRYPDTFGANHCNLQVVERPLAPAPLDQFQTKKPFAVRALPHVKSLIFSAAVRARCDPSQVLLQALHCPRGMSGSTWTCGTCTFDNLSNAAQCAVCGSERPSENAGQGGQSSGAHHVAESGQSAWACTQCTFLNSDGGTNCEVCGHEREQTGVVNKGGEVEGERKRKRETNGLNDGGASQGAGAGETGIEAGDKKRSGQGDGHRTVVDLDDDETLRSTSNQKGKEAGAEDVTSGPGGSGMGATGVSLLHQLHLERLARQAAKQKGSEFGGASTSKSGPSSAKSGPFSGKEKLGGSAVGEGVRERAGSSTFSRPDLEPNQASAATRNFASTSGGSGPTPSAKASGSVAPHQSAATSNPLTILSYNVWFDESVELQRRMAAIGAIIEEHSPDVIFFQEVTPNIYSIFREARWWSRGRYKCSLTPAEIDRQYFAMMVRKDCFDKRNVLSSRFEFASVVAVLALL